MIIPFNVFVSSSSGFTDAPIVAPPGGELLGIEVVNLTGTSEFEVWVYEGTAPVSSTPGFADGLLAHLGPFLGTTGIAGDVLGFPAPVPITGPLRCRVASGGSADEGWASGRLFV